MANANVERSIWINAPREQVWQAVTEPSQILQWMIPNMTWAELKRDDAGKLTLQIGPMENHLAMWEALDPTRNLRSRSLPEGMITTDYALNDHNGGTNVTVTMSGFEAMPEDRRDDRVQLSNKGWEESLQNLKAHVTGDALPFPTAFVGPLFGYWRTPGKTFGVERSIWIKATRERVWKALTDPKQYQAWFSPTTEWQLSALEIGGRFYVNEAGIEKYTQIFEILDAPERLVMRTTPEDADPFIKWTEYKLQAEDGGTRLYVAYTGYEPEPEESRWNHMEENTFGFGMMLMNAKAYIEGEPLPYPEGF